MKTCVIYATQEMARAPSRMAGVATTCGGVLARDNLATGSQYPHLKIFHIFFYCRLENL